MMHVPITALEGAMSKVEMETEVAIYSRVSNPEGLKECIRSEKQHQLEGQFSNGVKCRVRKVIVGDDQKCFFTYKLRGEEGNIDSCREFTVPVDEEFFEGFKKVAERNLVKTRYVFTSEKVTMKFYENGTESEVTIPNVSYEVDVYERADGSVCEWCKIDVEIDVILNYLKKEHPHLDGMQLNIKVSHLPFQPQDMILPQTATPEQQAKIDEIWKEFVQPVE